MISLELEYRTVWLTQAPVLQTMMPRRYFDTLFPHILRSEIMPYDAGML